MHRKGVYEFVGKNGASDGARTKDSQVGQPADGHPGLPKRAEMILLSLRHPGTAFNDHVLQALQKRRLFPLEGFEDMLGEGAFARAHFNNGEGSCRGDDAGHLRELWGNSVCEDRVALRAGLVILACYIESFQIVVDVFSVIVVGVYRYVERSLI